MPVGAEAGVQTGVYTLNIILIISDTFIAIIAVSIVIIILNLMITRYRDSLARTFARTSSGAKCATTAKTKTPPDQKYQEDADIAYRSKTTTANYSKTSFHSKFYIQHADLPAFRIKIPLDSKLLLLGFELSHKDSHTFYPKSFFAYLTKSSVRAHDRGFEGDEVIMSCRPRKTHDCQNCCTHTDDNRGPDARESQSLRDFRGPTIYGLDEAKRRE